MNRVFADTGYFVALVNSRDALKLRATAFASAYPGVTITTESVLVEVANFFSRAAARAAFRDLIDELDADPLKQIIESSSALFRRGIHHFNARPDKDWSLTDCISFVVMEDLKLSDALTADHHFI